MDGLAIVDRVPVSLRWTINPLLVTSTALPPWPLVVENNELEHVAWDGGHLVVFGELRRASTGEVLKSDVLQGVALPRFHYLLSPGETRPVSVMIGLRTKEFAAVPDGDYILKVRGVSGPFWPDDLHVDPPHALYIVIKRGTGPHHSPV